MSILKKALDNVGNVVNKAQAGTTLMSLESTFKVKESNIMQVVQQLKCQSEALYSKIGRTYFEKRSADCFQESDLDEFYSMLLDNQDKTVAQEQLLSDLKKAFEKEVEMIKGSTLQHMGYCSKCKSGYAIGVDIFCKECGNDLRADIHTPSENLCPKCNTAYDAETNVFCKKCGFKLKEVK